ncbi:hypothetical protein OSB04_002625 [Centaurea solstitialis]|uniref:Uncharacterized protein n=1 Tax=Centaurea solstitialis TaxID=347529 RepID=A0AA38WUX8_9ASTR|nr:hypothetical protein OSB04_002625 [Centaurea solstitialis]
MVVFYPNTDISRSSHHKMVVDMKSSLSQTLTKYYPFAGRHAKIAPSYVDCNDDGTEVLEASVGRTLLDLLQNSSMKISTSSFRMVDYGATRTIKVMIFKATGDPTSDSGNFFTYAKILTTDESEMEPESYIGELKKLKMQVQGSNHGSSTSAIPRLWAGLWVGSGPGGETSKNNNRRKSKEEQLCLDGCSKRDGIEARVCLGKQDMPIVQTDPELLEFC